jgi:hypothetical protein
MARPASSSCPHLGELHAAALGAAQLVDLAATGEQLFFDRSVGATGDDAARIEDVAVRRHQGHAHAVIPPHRDRGGEIRHQDDFAEQRLGDATILVAHAHEIEHLARRPVQALHAGEIGHARLQRNEARAPLRRLAQAVDGLRPLLLAADDHVLQALAEHRGDGALVLLRDVDDVGDDAQHAVRVMLFAHDRAHAAMEALVGGLDLLERGEPRAGLDEHALDLHRLPLPAAPRLGQRAQRVGARLLFAGRVRELATQPLSRSARRTTSCASISSRRRSSSLLAAQLVELAGDVSRRRARLARPLRTSTSRVTCSTNAPFAASSAADSAANAVRLAFSASSDVRSSPSSKARYCADASRSRSACRRRSSLVACATRAASASSPSRTWRRSRSARCSSSMAMRCCTLCRSASSTASCSRAAAWRCSASATAVAAAWCAC